MFVTGINSRLIIREGRLGAPLHSSAADASSDTKSKANTALSSVDSLINLSLSVKPLKLSSRIWSATPDSDQAFEEISEAFKPQSAFQRWLVCTSRTNKIRMFCSRILPRAHSGIQI